MTGDGTKPKPQPDGRPHPKPPVPLRPLPRPLPPPGPKEPKKLSIVQHEPDLAVSVARCLRVWCDQGYITTDRWMAHGPSGFKFVLTWLPIGTLGSVIVSQADHDGDEWIHASLAWSETMPTYEQLKILHESVFGPKRFAYQVFAASDQHVNIHGYALHLWGRVDGANVLPNFGGWGSI